VSAAQDAVAEHTVVLSASARKMAGSPQGETDTIPPSPPFILFDQQHKYNLPFDVLVSVALVLKRIFCRYSYCFGQFLVTKLPKY
jgi:hypothetical protein